MILKWGMAWVYHLESLILHPDYVHVASLETFLQLYFYTILNILGSIKQILLKPFKNTCNGILAAVS